MPLGKAKQFGRDWTDGDLTFPKHLTPEIIHSALFIYNAQGKEEIKARVKYLTKHIGDKAVAFAMALLVLPALMDMTKETQQYKDFLTSRKKTIN
jgi:hypothetical protein|tara:strand:+ start:314 stop:598 length:285 start_codon:yes stop_codon:yes gene_type:complete